MHTNRHTAEPEKMRRHWFRFRLRTMLIGVALSAVICGTAVWIIRDRQRLIDERDEATAEAIFATTLMHKNVHELERQLRELKDAAPAKP
jgi:hypothetical protein